MTPCRISTPQPKKILAICNALGSTSNVFEVGIVVVRGCVEHHVLVAATEIIFWFLALPMSLLSCQIWTEEQHKQILKQLSRTLTHSGNSSNRSLPALTVRLVHPLLSSGAFGRSTQDLHKFGSVRNLTYAHNNTAIASNIMIFG